MWEPLILLLFFVGVLLSSLFLVIVFLNLCLAHYRIKPCVVAAMSVILTGAMLEFSSHSLVFHLRWIFLPLISAAVVTAVSLTREEWKLIVETPLPERIPDSRWREIVMLVGGGVGSAVCVATGAGRAILLSLNYDVLGNTPEEMRDIFVVGIVIGYFGGSFVALFLWILGVRFNRRT